MSQPRFSSLQVGCYADSASFGGGSRIWSNRRALRQANPPVAPKVLHLEAKCIWRGLALGLRLGIRFSCEIWTALASKYLSSERLSLPTTGRPQSGAVLDLRCARRLHERAGRDAKNGSAGAEQKNDSKQEGKMPSDHILTPSPEQSTKAGQVHRLRLRRNCSSSRSLHTKRMYQLFKNLAYRT